MNICGSSWSFRPRSAELRIVPQTYAEIRRSGFRQRKAVLEHKETHPSSAASFLLIVVSVRLILWCRYRPVYSTWDARQVRLWRQNNTTSGFPTTTPWPKSRSIAATLNRQAKELRSVHTTQLATFAYEVRYTGEKLDGDATLKLLKAFNEFKTEPLSLPN